MLAKAAQRRLVGRVNHPDLHPATQVLAAAAGVRDHRLAEVDTDDRRALADHSTCQ